MIEVDGRHGEGGGQLLRNTAALSAITGRPARVTHIRAKRKKPGLAAQHVAALRGVARIANAEVEGLEVGSETVTVHPGSIAPGRFRVDVGTAGSVTLVLQACLPVALRASGPVELTVTGGTDVPWSPPADYVRHVFLPLLGRMGGRATMDVERRGYFPRGGGAVSVRTEPVETFLPLDLEPPGAVTGVGGHAHTARLPDHVALRMRQAALKALAGTLPASIESSRIPEGDVQGPGGAIVLWADRGNTVLGVSALTERGVPADRLGRTAAQEILADVQAGVSLDLHALDQVLLYASLAAAPSRASARKLTSHAETTMWVLQKFLDVRFEMTQDESRVDVRVTPPSR